MERYRHSQIGWVIIIFFGLFALVESFMMAGMVMKGVSPVVVLFPLLMVVFGYLGSTLTVVVTPSEVRLWFGPGICKKSYNISDIVSVEKIRQPWYMGYGIKYIPGRKIWLYNVSGRWVVQIKLGDGRVRRIGTDEPDKLEQAIKEVMNN